MVITNTVDLQFWSDDSSAPPSEHAGHAINCTQTDNLELKKLVYLYLMNYAKSQPDLAIMAVNTFVKVSDKVGGRFEIV